MRKRLGIMLIILLLMGCGHTDKSTKDLYQTTDEDVYGSSESTTFELTIEELAQYNGQDGNRAFIAVDNVVYEVTSLEEWHNGAHADGKYVAGKDYSKEILESPHGIKMLDDVPIVGKLIK